MAKPWPYMYRPASPGMDGFPIMPFGCALDMSQSAARRMLSLYLPSRRVLPSMSRLMPPRPVMVIGYWPPNASQWPSLCCWSAIHLRPLVTVSRYSAGISSARTGPPPARNSKPPKTATVRKAARMSVGSSFNERNKTIAGRSNPSLRYDDSPNAFSHSGRDGGERFGVTAGRWRAGRGGPHSSTNDR